MSKMGNANGIWVHKEDICYLGDTLEDTKTYLENSGHGTEEIAVMLQTELMSTIRGWAGSTFPQTTLEVRGGDMAFMSWSTLFELGNCLYRLISRGDDGKGLGHFLWILLGAMR